MKKMKPNLLCQKCKHNCKQNMKPVIIECPKYEKLEWMKQLDREDMKHDAWMEKSDAIRGEK